MDSQTRFLLLLLVVIPTLCESMVRHYKFDVKKKTTTKLCSTKQIVTVNGRFPGPTLHVREDDTIIVNVVNHVKYNVTIHWHGVRQLRNGWADGTAYITQCPIQPNHNYVYNFTVKGQRGTLLWHAHILWLRSTVHGAIVIHPNHGVPYPFKRPHKELVIILAEWWKADTEAVINEALRSGSGPNASDAHIINGHSKSFPSCQQEGFTLPVKHGKTYMLRIINAALNDDLFFKIANHQMKVVEVDATYVKPFTTNAILISPGQTTNVLLTANRKTGKYLVTGSSFKDISALIGNTTATATLEYAGTPSSQNVTLGNVTVNPVNVAYKYISSLHSLNSDRYPARVPIHIDHDLYFTVGLGTNPCPSCKQNNGIRLVGSINNVTFDTPKISLLNAHLSKINGVFTTDFPAKPPHTFNYSGEPPLNIQTTRGTKVYRLAYNSTVQLVLQDTKIITAEPHPVHLHGFNFFVVGTGNGNYNPEKDPKSFNLIDPVERNTVAVPYAGWVAIRFRADNPGVWLFHCHVELHTTWGLKMAFLVENGRHHSQEILPPPKDLPKC